MPVWIWLNPWVCSQRYFRPVSGNRRFGLATVIEKLYMKKKQYEKTQQLSAKMVVQKRKSTCLKLKICNCDSAGKNAFPFSSRLNINMQRSWGMSFQRVRFYEVDGSDSQRVESCTCFSSIKLQGEWKFSRVY